MSSSIVKIFDNIVSIAAADEIENILAGVNFPWYLSVAPGHHTVDTKEIGALNNSNLNVKEYIQLVHNFLSDGEVRSPFFQPVHDLFIEFQKKTQIEIEGYYRVKANLQTQCNFSTEDFCNTPHVDATINHKVAIYYVNDSDGETVILKNNSGIWEIAERILPKKGRFVVFDGKYYHAGRHPKYSDKRIVINCNFI